MTPVRRSGLTLIELLVVLTILAVLTTLAVVATQGVVDQARFETTQRTLQNIQDAILGPTGQRGGDGSQLITGFVADMGRLPQPVYVGGSIVGDPLRELWDPTAITANSGIGFSAQTLNLSVLNSSFVAVPLYNAPTGTVTTPVAVTVPCGWRGPYLQLAVGTSGSALLLDGWGNPFQSLYQAPSSLVYPATPSPAMGTTLAQPINVVCSLGADNVLNTGIPANPYDLDQFVPTQTTAPPAPPLASFSDRLYGTISVTVQSINSTVTPTALTNPFQSASPIMETAPMVCVVLFAPSNGLLTAFNLDATPSPNAYNPNSTSASYLTNPNPKQQDFALSTTSGSTTAVSGSFYNVPTGSRAIQAFQYDATPTPVGQYKVTKRSPLIYLNVPASGVSITLVLQ